MTEEQAPAPLARFLVPSLAGAAIFLFPVFWGDQQTVVFGLITDVLRGWLEPWLQELLLGVLLASAVLTPLYPLLRDTAAGRGASMRRLFDVHPVWVLLRVGGGITAALIYFQIGPEAIWGADTGRVVFNDIGIAVMLIFVVSVFLLGLLTDYGLMEFVGVLLATPFQRLFRLPGRAAIDATASFVAAASVGLLITIRQYERGIYSGREASIIVCSFSVVSVPFALLIADVAKIQAVFFGWYATVILACILAAVLLARIGPLASKADTYFGGAASVDDDAPTLLGTSGLRRAVLAGRLRAASGQGPADYLREAVVASLDLLFGVLGAIIVLATAASVLIFHTPVFDWIAWPLAWLLDLGGFPDAFTLAPGFLVGLLDQFMPVLVALKTDSEFARFVLAGLSVSQLIFLTEFGVIVLRSPLPVSLLDLVITFLLRTLVVAPVLMLGAALVI